MLSILSLCAFLFRFVFICGVCSSFLWPSGACSVMTGRWLAFATSGGDESPLSDSIATGGDESPLRDSIDQGRPMGGGAAVSVAIVPWAPPTSKVPFGWVSPAEHRDMRRCAGAFARSHYSVVRMSWPSSRRQTSPVWTRPRLACTRTFWELASCTCSRRLP